MDRKEQIQRAKELLESGVLSEESANAIKADFPELSESDDERIRKALVEKISNLACGCLISQEQKQNFLAYLEKQKPNIELIQRSWYMEGYHDREFGQEPKWIIKTGEGGPKYEKNEKYGQPLEQKPAKWSEEDEERLNSIIESYKVLLKDYKACHDVDYILYNSDTVIRNVVDNVKFLKSLRPQPRWKPSEEQMCELNWASKLSPVLESLYNDLKKL